jgi:hypothetical protein
MFTVHFHKNVSNNLQQMHFQYIYCISTSTCGYTINILKVHLLEVIIYIKMDLLEVGWRRIDVSQDKDRWRAVVIAVMNLRVP